MNASIPVEEGLVLRAVCDVRVFALLVCPLVTELCTRDSSVYHVFGRGQGAIDALLCQDLTYVGVNIETGALRARFALFRVVIEVGALGTALAAVGIRVIVLSVLGALLCVALGLLAAGQHHHPVVDAGIGPCPVVAAAQVGVVGRLLLAAMGRCIVKVKLVTLRAR